FLVLALAEIDHGAMAAIWADHALLAVEHGEWVFIRCHVQGRIRGHARYVFLDMKLAPALATSVLPVLYGERFHRHHGAGHDRRAVPASSHLTGSVLAPEGVDDFRTFVAVIL